MKTNRLLLVVLLALAGSLASAQSPKTATPSPAVTSPAAKGPARAYPLKICLVTDSDLDSMGDEVAIVHQGQVIKFCCKPCEKKFLRNPDKYLAKLAALEAGRK
jgi:hypothetical protein